MKSFAQLSMLLLGTALIFSSCVQFESPMPPESRELSSFPANLVGDYVFDKGDEQNENSNSLFDFDRFSIGANSLTIDEGTKNVGEDIILRPYMSYLVVNIQDEEQEGWSVILLDLQSVRTGPLKVGMLMDVDGKLDKFEAIVGHPIDRGFGDNNENAQSVVSMTTPQFQQLIKQDIFTFVDAVKE